MGTENDMVKDFVEFMHATRDPNRINIEWGMENEEWWVGKVDWLWIHVYRGLSAPRCRDPNLRWHIALSVAPKAGHITWAGVERFAPEGFSTAEEAKEKAPLLLQHFGKYWIDIGAMLRRKPPVETTTPPGSALTIKNMCTHCGAHDIRRLRNGL